MEKLNKTIAIADFNEDVVKSISNNTEDTNKKDSITYLFFKKGEEIITTFKSDDGWWYGYRNQDNILNRSPELGFFPYTFINVIEEYNQPSNLYLIALTYQYQKKMIKI